MRPGSTSLPPGEGPSASIQSSLRSLENLACLQGPSGGRGGGNRGGQLADSGAQEMQGDLQEQWVSFWGADIRRGADMWWRGWNQGGKVGPPRDCPTATALVPKALQREPPKYLSCWVGVCVVGRLCGGAVGFH